MSVQAESGVRTPPNICARFTLSPEERRSRSARAAAEKALVRIAHHYGERPSFVLLGGLVPDLLCSQSAVRHLGTTDVDVQVDLEIAAGAANTKRLERALLNAEFHPDSARVWRWRSADEGVRTVVKFELLADLDDLPAHQEVRFDDCENLGAINLKGTGFASRDVEEVELTAMVGEDLRRVKIQVTGIAGFLLAKTAAARSRRLPKDWYDIAYVLRHNDLGGPAAAADFVIARFPDDLTGAVLTSLLELEANFSRPGDQGPAGYAAQMGDMNRALDAPQLRAEAVTVVSTFLERLRERGAI
ncbi:MAG: hypothetical protein EA351_13720 [Gemmatimonadales bacterium]|nr:MAG: hypothetical protein EA351_13720 [Gemmatimonadales bacterium]